MIGTLVNVGAVVAGSVVGLLLHARLPKRLSEIAFQAIGLFTVFIGVKMALDLWGASGFEPKRLLILIFSIVGGSIIGELIDIDRHLTRFGEWLKARLRLGSERFSEGLVTAFLVFCMGSMTVLGAVEEGTGKTPTLFFAKSLLDGVGSIAFSAALGIGVVFSVIPLLVYQGGLTLLARVLGTVLSDAIVAEMTAVGGLMLIGLGTNLLDIKKLKVINMLPALVIAALLTWAFFR